MGTLPLALIFLQEAISHKLLRQRWEGWPVAADLAIVYILACVTVESYGVVQDD